MVQNSLLKLAQTSGYSLFNSTITPSLHMTNINSYQLEKLEMVNIWHL